MSLSLFQELFIRIFLILVIVDSFIWWFMNKGMNTTVISLFIIEMVVITITLWFDVIYKKKSLKR
jgi:hypothetical protein